MDSDATNIEIIRHLRDGRKSFKEIAEEMSLSENTVRARVQKMVKESVLDIVGLVDPDAIEGHQVVIVGVKVDTMDLEKKGEEFSRLKGVVSVGVVTGRYDLMLTVILNSDFKLLDFFKHEMAKVKDVQSTETFVLFKNFGWRVPYIL
ncbi:MAG: Lrp/AsnC family transcriptional regulator [Deltaproteobacteria bacterium]|uniref:Lrp/AsnC family transcriptional regulator n=1 Tax=Candidatus Zymogenus saltonus TaxID=2844893 RepID=A0A9D8KFC5_9DELT|nr:Lrp/AsnC family transcriptional regulator [Candidatus Zymogenus saltonus]